MKRMHHEKDTHSRSRQPKPDCEKQREEYRAMQATIPRRPMLDELKLGQLSPDPVERKCRRSNSREKLKSAASGTNDNTLSKPEPESLPKGIQNNSNDTIPSDDSRVVEVDASTNTVNVYGPIFGTKNPDSTSALAYQVANVVLNASGKHGLQNLKWALPIISGIGPKDELEGLLAVQMIGVHSLAMDCLKRASQEGQTPELMDININRATKLLRTFPTQMEALNRHRGMVSQQMVVGNVNVNEGGQAIVGSVSHDGRGKASSEDDADKVK
jgi:hypothetical protein